MNFFVNSNNDKDSSRMSNFENYDDVFKIQRTIESRRDKIVVSENVEYFKRHKKQHVLKKWWIPLGFIFTISFFLFSHDLLPFSMVDIAYMEFILNCILIACIVWLSQAI